MDFKTALMKDEANSLTSWAVKSGETKGRRYPEPECPLRLAFQIDRDRISHSKAFRRLKHKTQVFIAPEGDHYRTRLTHTLEVAQIARTIAKLLHLNEDLTEAIALGHDLGHTPYGHAGEEALNKLADNGFSHNQQSLRVVEWLESPVKEFPGLNLTVEVRDGILHHTGAKLPATAEGRIVKWADRIAYLNHDLDDAIRGQLIQLSDLPNPIIAKFGTDTNQWLTILIQDMVETSYIREDIAFSPEIAVVFNQLYDFLFERVYIGSAAKVEETKVFGMFKSLLDYFSAHLEEIPELFKRFSNGNSQLAVVDYIAGMTDHYVTEIFMEKFIPQSWSLH